MDKKRLLSFIKAAELGSISAAAEELGYSTSAVSQLIASLEKEFGMRLLVRTTRGVYPAEEAKGLIPIVEDFLSGEQKILDYVDGVKDISEGTLTIAAYPSIATTWLPGIMSEFRNDYPGINITIMEGVRSDIYRHLDNNEAELAFLAYADPMPYEWIPLADERLIAVLPENHPMADRASFPIKQIENEDFILSSSGRETEILDMLKKHGVRPEIKFTTYDTPVNMAMVQQGLGVSIVNELSARRWNEKLVKMPLDPPEMVTFGIAYHSLDRLTPAAHKFLDYSVRNLTKEASPEA